MLMREGQKGFKSTPLRQFRTRALCSCRVLGFETISAAYLRGQKAEVAGVKALPQGAVTVQAVLDLLGNCTEFGGFARLLYAASANHHA